MSLKRKRKRLTRFKRSFSVERKSLRMLSVVSVRPNAAIVTEIVGHLISHGRITVMCLVSSALPIPPGEEDVHHPGPAVQTGAIERSGVLNDEACVTWIR